MKQIIICIILILFMGCRSIDYTFNEKPSVYDKKLYTATKQDILGLSCFISQEPAWGILALTELPFNLVSDTILSPYAIYLDAKVPQGVMQNTTNDTSTNLDVSQTKSEDDSFYNVKRIKKPDLFATITFHPKKKLGGQRPIKMEILFAILFINRQGFSCCLDLSDKKNVFTGKAVENIKVKLAYPILGLPLLKTGSVFSLRNKTFNAKGIVTTMTATQSPTDHRIDGEK